MEGFLIFSSNYCWNTSMALSSVRFHPTSLWGYNKQSASPVSRPNFTTAIYYLFGLHSIVLWCPWMVSSTKENRRTMRRLICFGCTGLLFCYVGFIAVIGPCPWRRGLELEIHPLSTDEIPLFFFFEHVTQFPFNVFVTQRLESVMWINI